MGKIKIHAGDYPKTGTHQFSFGNFILTPKESWGLKTDTYTPSMVEEVTIASEEDGVRLFGAVGWGALGAVLAGPVGLLIGGVLGGRGKKVVFIAKFKNGKKILAETDSKTWTKIQAAMF